MLSALQDLMNAVYDPKTRSLVVSLVSMGNKYDTASDKLVVVADTSTEVLSSNPNRRYTLIVNNSNEVIYLRLGNSAELHRGIPLHPNGSYEINLLNLYSGVISAICEVGGKNLLVTEA